MKRKQFLALMLTIALTAGTNATAVTSLAAERAVALSALQGAAQQGGTVLAADEDGDDSDTSVLEQAIGEAVENVSSAPARKRLSMFSRILTEPSGISQYRTGSRTLKERKNSMTTLSCRILRM